MPDRGKLTPGDVEKPTPRGLPRQSASLPGLAFRTAGGGAESWRFCSLWDFFFYFQSKDNQQQSPSPQERLQPRAGSSRESGTMGCPALFFHWGLEAGGLHPNPISASRFLQRLRAVTGTKGAQSKTPRSAPAFSPGHLLGCTVETPVLSRCSQNLKTGAKLWAEVQYYLKCQGVQRMSTRTVGNENPV